MLLEVEDLTVDYGGIRAVDGVSFALDQGAVLAVLGANGAGKSSLLHALMGVSEGTVGGRVRFKGEEIRGRRPDEIVTRGIAMSPEGRRLFADLTVAENLAIGGFRRRDRAAMRRDREEILDLFPRLRERLNQSAGTLSGGEQQMVAVGRALMAAPDLLLLDEPTLGLAPLFIEEIMALIAEIRGRGITIVVVEQNAKKALARADFAHVMERGRIVLSGSAAEMGRRDEIVSAYLGMH